MKTPANISFSVLFLNWFSSLQRVSLKLYQDSWKRKLRQKFKNLRRPARAEKAGIAAIDVPVSEKKRKIEAPSPDGPTPSDIAEYDENCKYLQKVYKSQKWSEVGMATLLEETADQRNKWIRKESPTVAVIFDRFPCLKEANLVSIRNCNIIIYHTIICT